MYKLICFDLDDTLWPCMPVIQQAEQTLYNWLKLHKPLISQTYSIDQLREKRQQLMQTQPQLINDLSVARRVHLTQLANEFSDTTEWVESAFNIFYEARQKVTLFDDVIPTLSALKSDYILVALTNGNAHISKTGLAEIFDFQISAADVLAAKPDPAMFLKAMKKTQTGPAQTLHVGDHPVHDIRGAYNAGVDAVWMNRLNRVWNENEPKPTQQFADLNQLQNWLSKLSV